MIIRISESGTHSTESLKHIRELYRETVMEVPHFEQDYGESSETNIETAFRPEIAASVVNGDLLTPQLQAALFQSAQQAKRKRSRFLQTLEQERENLITAKRSFHQIH